MEGLVLLRHDRAALTTQNRVLDDRACVVRIPEGATNIETWGDRVTRAPKMIKYTYQDCEYWDNGVSGPMPAAWPILQRAFAACRAAQAERNGLPLTDPFDYLYN